MKTTFVITAILSFLSAHQGLANPISAGAASSYAVTNGSIKSWGLNHTSEGRLGCLSTTLTSTFTPTNVLQNSDSTILSNVRSVAAGRAFALALLNDGTIAAWGDNSRGELGLGGADYTDRYAAVPTAGITAVAEIDAGQHIALALGSNGLVYAWGDNGNGHIGTAISASVGKTNVPHQVVGLSNITKIAIGTQHSLALKSDGKIWAWGNGTSGRLGTGVTGTPQPTPLEVTSLSNVTNIAAAINHNLAITSDGRLWSWGVGTAATSGALGDGYSQVRTNAVLVTDQSYIEVDITVLTNEPTIYNLPETNINNCLKRSQMICTTVETNYCTNTYSLQSNVVAVAAGATWSLALTSQGRVWAWGNNSEGQLGIGVDGGNYETPQPVKDPSGTGYLKNVVAISAARHTADCCSAAWHNMALLADGRVVTWGQNNKEQLGVSTNTYPTISTLPVYVQFP